MELGHLICATDPEAVRTRDARMKAAAAAGNQPPPRPLPRLGPGLYRKASSDHRLLAYRRTDAAAQGISTKIMMRRMLSPACVRVAGPWTRENAAGAACGARPGRCRPGRFDDGGRTVGGGAGLAGDGDEVVRPGDGLVPVGLGLVLGLRDGLGRGDGLAIVGLGDALITVGVGDGVADGLITVGVEDGLADGDGHAPSPEPVGNGDAVDPVHGHLS
jgi:hypothetical protein